MCSSEPEYRAPSPQPHSVYSPCHRYMQAGWLTAAVGQAIAIITTRKITWRDMLRHRLTTFVCTTLHIPYRGSDCRSRNPVLYVQTIRAPSVALFPCLVTPSYAIGLAKLMQVRTN